MNALVGMKHVPVLYSNILFFNGVFLYIGGVFFYSKSICSCRTILKKCIVWLVLVQTHFGMGVKGILSLGEFNMFGVEYIARMFKSSIC